MLKHTRSHATLLALVSSLALPRIARADDGIFSDNFELGQPEPTVLIGLGLAATTLTFATADLLLDKPGTTYGIVETAVNAPLVALATYAAIRGAGDDRTAVFGVVAAIHAGFVAHGIYTIHRTRSARTTTASFVPIASGANLFGATLTGSF